MSLRIFNLAISLLFVTLIACKESAPVDTSPYAADTSTSDDPAAAQAERIIREAVGAAGLDSLARRSVTFRFRDKHYGYHRADGRFRYERWWDDSTSGEEIRDVLDNDTLIRYTAGKPTPLETKKTKAYSNSVNSVIYFAFMPWALLDPAVRPTYLGEDLIDGKRYDRIAIDFAVEGGGEDHSDDFLYWFDSEDRSLDYFAYAHPGGLMPRFRVATNVRAVGGVRVQDYDNFAYPEGGARNIDSLLDDYRRGALILLSEIDLEEVEVRAVED